jgi:hypothetical protein
VLRCAVAPHRMQGSISLCFAKRYFIIDRRMVPARRKARSSRGDMDIIAIIVTIALVLGPLLAYRHHRRVSAAAATAIAKMPLQPIVAHCSRLAMLPILLGNLVGSSVFLIFALDKHVPSDVQPQAIRYGGVALCGIVFLVWCYRFLFRAGDELIVLDDAGFRDRRISPDIIRWSTIEDVVEWRDPKSRQRLGIVLKIDEAQTASPRLKPRSWIARKLNAASGYRPLRIASRGLDVAPGTMLATARGIWPCRDCCTCRNRPWSAGRRAFSE